MKALIIFDQNKQSNYYSSREALEKRYQQGWVLEIVSDLNHLMRRVREAKKNNEVKIWFFIYLKLNFIDRLSSDITFAKESKNILISLSFFIFYKGRKIQLILFA